MSNWQTPKTNWGQPGQTVPVAADFNRIEGNIQYLQDTKETPAGAQAKADAAATVVQANLDAHKADYIRQPGYATATGSANTYSITLNPAPTAYVDGMAISVKINVDNTGASTINVNGLGAKPIKKPNGNDVAAGNLKAGSIYTLRYNGTNFILQGSDAAGTATPEDVTAGKTFSNDDDTDLVGALPILGNRSTTLIINGPDTPQVVIPPGRIDQSTIVAELDPSLAPLIRENNNIGGVEGTFAGKRWATGIAYPSDYYLDISVDFAPSLIVYYRTGDDSIYVLLGVASRAADIKVGSLTSSHVSFSGGSPQNVRIETGGIIFGTTGARLSLPIVAINVPIRWWAFE